MRENFRQEEENKVVTRERRDNKIKIINIWKGYSG